MIPKADWTQCFRLVISSGAAKSERNESFVKKHKVFFDAKYVNLFHEMKVLFYDVEDS